MLKLLAFFLLRLAGTVHCLGSANPDSGFSIPNSPSKRTSNFIQNDTLLETASDTEVQSSPCACGVRNQRQLRIIGGIGHAPNEFPFSALLVKLNADGTLGWNPFCGGSIVTNKHILTAAHCFDKRYYLSLLKVALGAHGWKQNDFGDKLHGVDKVIVHEKYASTSSMYDIALLVLSNTLTFNENIVPVCLPSPSLDVMGQTVKVIGYGAQSFPGGMVALPAQFDTIVVPEAHCASRSKTPVPGSTLCTWSTNGAPCKGDSGGPVVWLDPHTNTYTLVGIVSHGWSCNVMQHPSVQTLVTHYLPWIFNHLDGGGIPTTCKSAVVIKDPLLWSSRPPNELIVRSRPSAPSYDA